MISPELLRRYPFFSFLTPDALREVAMITDELTVDDGAILFEMGAKAEALYFLIAGSVELHFVVMDEHEPDLRKDFLVGTISPGEIFGISSVIEPYALTATAVTVEPSRLLQITAVALRQLLEQDQALAIRFLQKVNKATMERLQKTRVELAAATG